MANLVRITVLVLLGMGCLGRPLVGQEAEPQVSLTIAAFPPCQVYLETATGPTYLGRSGVPLKFAPPALTDARGRFAEFARGVLVLRADRHAELRVPLSSTDWSAARLPAGGGVYRPVAGSIFVSLMDYVRAYPWAFGVALLLGGWLAWAARGWRRELVTRRRENRVLNDQLTTTGDPMIGKRLGSYRVTARIGQGGMGTVYGVEDEKGARFAAKVIYTTGQDATSLQRFRREFKVMASLTHPSLVRGFDYGEEDGLAYCVMEFVVGQTLDQKIPPEGLPWPEFCALARALLTGLACAHAQGIVHRDLKPGNIMVTQNGVKILDFGLARPVDMTAITGTGNVFGTPAYISPEQLMASSREVDPRSDQYSLGIVFFEMLTGSVPFSSQEIQEVISMHIARIPPKVSKLRGGIPRTVDDLVARMLAKQPHQRFGCLEDVLDALEALEFDEPTSTVQRDAEAGPVDLPTLALSRRPDLDEGSSE